MTMLRCLVQCHILRSIFLLTPALGHYLGERLLALFSSCAGLSHSSALLTENFVGCSLVKNLLRDQGLRFLFALQDRDAVSPRVVLIFGPEVFFALRSALCPLILCLPDEFIELLAKSQGLSLLLIKCFLGLLVGFGKLPTNTITKVTHRAGCLFVVFNFTAFLILAPDCLKLAPSDSRVRVDVSAVEPLKGLVQLLLNLTVNLHCRR